MNRHGCVRQCELREINWTKSIFWKISLSLSIVMNTSDLCSVCHVSMAKRPLARLIPCQHLLHQACFTALEVHGSNNCPLCRQDVANSENVERKIYKKYSATDRTRILEAARDLRDWRAVCSALGVNPATAYRWITKDQDAPKSKKNTRRPKLTETQIESLIEHIEGDSKITLQQMKLWVLQQYQIDMHVTSISRYLHGRAISYKGVHYEPQSMNSVEKKLQRREYVLKLIGYMQQGKFK